MRAWFTALAEVEALASLAALAHDNPDATLPYIQSHAQEMSTEVLDAHIHTFVNEFSMDLGERGREAVAILEEKARHTGIIT